MGFQLAKMFQIEYRPNLYALNYQIIVSRMLLLVHRIGMVLWIETPTFVTFKLDFFMKSSGYN